jgi:DHA1 family bicyclomycin/chloramphenicol resistance-like MFS transporter
MVAVLGFRLLTTTSPPRFLLAILLLVVPLSQVPLDIYTPAMPQMVLDLNSTSAAVQNTVTAYILGMSLAFIPLGVLADAVGRKRVLLSCLAIVVVTSFACAAINSIGLLLAVRFAQGAAASACMVLSYAIAADCFSGSRLTSVSGVLGAAWGLAPVLAPAVGGVLVQFVSWRWVFVLIAALGVLAFAVVAAALPETLGVQHRSVINPTTLRRTFRSVVANRVFACFVVVFGVMATAQLAFGVMGPFLYQDGLGFAPATYGLIALTVGVANLLGEIACGALATRISTRRLAFGALGLFGTGAAVLVISALTVGLSAWAITVGACLALAGCGVLCPQMYGSALGLFRTNLGLVGGIISAGCYLIVSAALAAVGVLPEQDQSTLGWLYVVCGVSALVLLAWATSNRRSAVAG